MNSLPHFEEAFGKQGLVIPLFSNMIILKKAYLEIMDSEDPDDRRIEEILSSVYTTGHMAAMVLNRYPHVPFISEYQISISEAVEAHFLGLGHAAVAGLIPVIEGAGRNLARSKGLEHEYVGRTFSQLTEAVMAEVRERKLGDYEAVISVLKSFLSFIKDYFYSDSRSYLLSDRTNRNGISHGHFKDADYGTSLNFYKTLSALDALCLMAEFQVFPAKSTADSEVLALYYLTAKEAKQQRFRELGQFLSDS